ncbi:ubiquinone biosynthesis accessory factor UbiJ [Pseudomaricurvus sp.]|uniref:ubiquinone biosynthesis accessory factor UbiJ n=1 Tax=Pseudomaricurvus sp. TaxID=2004510 RepID=UPI003F6B1AC1
MVDPTLSAAATASLEAAINKALRYDPASRLRCQALAGKSLAIEIALAGKHFPLCCHFEEDGIRISANIDDPTTCLRGSLPGLLVLATSERVNLAEANVEAWGNTALLADIKSIASDLDLDWEEAINEWLGDVAGHQLAEKARSQFRWIKERGQSGKRLMSEFLTEELRAIPSAAELQHFNDQVDALRLASDRLLARFERLRSSSTKSKA